LIRELADFDLSVDEIALALRERVLEEEPAAVEKLFRVYALVFWYSFTGRMADDDDITAVGFDSAGPCADNFTGFVARLAGCGQADGCRRA
jgi:hypothetical protein